MVIQLVFIKLSQYYLFISVKRDQIIHRHILCRHMYAFAHLDILLFDVRRELELSWIRRRENA